MFGWKHTQGDCSAMANAAALIALCMLLTACAPPAPSQAQFRIPVDLRCTTCNDFLRCSAAGIDAAQASAPLLVYRLNEKSFWAQVATIGDYLVQAFRSKTRDARPYSLYRRSDGVWQEVEHGMATVDIVAARIEFSSAVIDQRSGDWRSGAVAGSCSAMPRREGFALIRQMLGRPLPAHAAPGSASLGS